MTDEPGTVAAPAAAAGTRDAHDTHDTQDAAGTATASPADDDRDGGAGAPAARRPPGRGVAVLGWVLAGVFLVSTVLLAVVAVGLKADKDELVDGRAEVEEVAGRFVHALLAYDHRDMDGFREQVLALTAPPFSEQFETAVDGLEAGIVAGEQVSTPTVEDVFVTEVEDGAATAIVVYGRVVDGTAGQREESNLYVRLGLVSRGGAWRVNDVVNLNLAFAAAG